MHSTFYAKLSSNMFTLVNPTQMAGVEYVLLNYEYKILKMAWSLKYVYNPPSMNVLGRYLVNRNPGQLGHIKPWAF
jgi:hypothetical protein